MANKLKKRKPFWWWIETKRGIEITHYLTLPGIPEGEVRPATVLRGYHLLFPWRSIRAALKRKDK